MKLNGNVIGLGSGGETDLEWEDRNAAKESVPVVTKPNYISLTPPMLTTLVLQRKFIMAQAKPGMLSCDVLSQVATRLELSRTVP